MPPVPERRGGFGSLAGRAVVLTFVNLDAHNGQGSGVQWLRMAWRQRLGRRAGRVAWVAAAVNCASGPPATKRWAASPAGVLGLSGSAAALSAVRRAYPAGVRGPGRRLTHTPALYVLSRQGREEILTLAAPAARTAAMH